ncbi:MAG: hypothetical protein ACKKL5_02385 [Candidatus Komeilibacteria bacterium]
MKNIDKFEKVRKMAEDDYKKLDSVYNPFLKKNIKFNVKGLNHIKGKDWNRGRLIEDQYLRLKFLKFVPNILRLSGTMQEFQERRCVERVRINARWDFVAKDVKYYGFVAIINFNIKIKVIVKEVANGVPYFWSVIPFWKTRKNPIVGVTKKVFHEGDLEND